MDFDWIVVTVILCITHCVAGAVCYRIGRMDGYEAGARAEMEARAADASNVRRASRRRFGQ